MRCVTRNEANVLMARSIGDAPKLNPSPDDTWGLHLIDVNFPLGQLTRIVGAQSRSYMRGRR